MTSSAFKRPEFSVFANFFVILRHSPAYLFDLLRGVRTGRGFPLPISVPASVAFLCFGTFPSLISHLALLMMCYMAFSLRPHHCYGCFFFFFLSCLFCRSLTSNLPNVNLPNVNLQIPKVPNLPVPVAGLSVNLPQMPSFSTPSWMAAIYDSECVFN